MHFRWISGSAESAERQSDLPVELAIVVLRLGKWRGNIPARLHRDFFSEKEKRWNMECVVVQVGELKARLVVASAVPVHKWPVYTAHHMYTFNGQ